MKKQEYLGWEPYKPLIVNDADLFQFLPKDKHDVVCEVAIEARELLTKLQNSTT